MALTLSDRWLCRARIITKKVEEWLRSYPNLKVISRDGAQTYSSATSNAHSDAVQVSDRFHLLKNLSDAVEKYMRRLFLSRLTIPAAIADPQIQALYNTRNRAERIAFAHLKRNEGCTINDIALLLHSATTTVRKYLAIPENEIPEIKENARERQYIQGLEKKQLAINEVRQVYASGHSIDEISRLTGHTTVTIKKYLKEDCPVSNGHYDSRRPRKLAPYESGAYKGTGTINISRNCASLMYSAKPSGLRCVSERTLCGA